jgi:shikimate dehydrogenase
VAHSLSPALHNAAFSARGLDIVYVALRVEATALRAAIEGLVALRLRGANVTVPHKGAVLPYLDWLSDDARRVEAVNTIVVEGGELRGFNTDVHGARWALREACGDSLRGASGLLLGAGGAARAVALAVARMGVRLTVVDRTAGAAHRLADLAEAAVPGSIERWMPLSALTTGEVTRQRLVVNATSLGMRGAGKVPALLADTVSAGQVVFDVVYGPGETDLLRDARVRGATTVDGRAMLVGQAAAAFELWTAEEAPLDVMRDALAT